LRPIDRAIHADSTNKAPFPCYPFNRQGQLFL
jgi:hypothetical protein